DDFDTPALLRAYRQLGCVTCQFYRNETAPPDLAEAKRIAEAAGLPFDSIHGVFGEAYDPSSPDETVRARAIEVYRREADVALALGGPMVVVHPAPPAPRRSVITPEQ